jgi:hypothetical protein
MMKRVLPLACLVGLLGSLTGMDYAVAEGTCASKAKPAFMSGSPPGPRSVIAIRADPTDKAHCIMKSNLCRAPTPKPTVVESAPTCQCECR